MKLSKQDVTVRVGVETMELSAIVGGYLERRRYNGYSKAAAISDFLNFYNGDRKESGVLIM